MSQQAPVLCISNGDNAWSGALCAIGTFPLIDTSWGDALEGIDRVRPAAVLVADCDVADTRFEAVAAKIAGIEPYVPLIAINPKAARRAPNVIAFSAGDGNLSRLQGRLSAALRVRALHATVLRRIADDASMRRQLPDGDPLDDATVLLIGRGTSYPALSIALGERMGVVGALSIEAAAAHLNARDLDGVVIGEGFSHRVVDAFLTVLSEDPRFRDLPAILTGQAAAFGSVPGLPNLEIASGPAEQVAADAVPLIRQHAFDARLTRALKSLDAGGQLDARTGLLTTTAFDGNFSSAIDEALDRGGGLSAARFTFNVAQDRVRFDAARTLSRLMRRTDFASLQADGSILVAFAETDLRTAHMVARRLASVLKHTLHGLGRDKRVDPVVTLVTLLPKDTERTLRDRLYSESRRAAS
jgi:hypothetical protein